MIEETPLEGGNVGGGIVRVGATVRRPLPRRAPAVHALLRHLEARGFDAAPRFLGIDEKGREILSWTEGDCGATDVLWANEAAQLACARLLRRLHEATRDFPWDAHEWLIEDPDPCRHEVVCHHDFAPYNLVFRDGLPVGVIDFDLAGPGPVRRDVAYAAFWSVPLAFGPDDPTARRYAEMDLGAGSPRLRSFCAEYGIPADDALLAAVSVQLEHMGDRSAMIRILGPEVTARLESAGHLDHWQAEAASFGERVERLSLNLAAHPSGAIETPTIAAQ